MESKTTSRPELSDFILENDYACWCGRCEARFVCKQMFGRRRFVVLVCMECGTHRILPRALAQQSSAETLYNEYQGVEVAKTADGAYVEHTLRRFQTVGVNFSKGTTVLDVGCGSGAILEAVCARYGAIGMGIDVDQRRIAKAKAAWMHAAFECALFDPAKLDQKYDVVLSIAVIEHVVEPVSFLQQLSLALKEDGSLFVLTPNAGSLSYRVLKSWWRELLSIGEHIYLFTPESLQRAAERAGLQVVNQSSDFDFSHRRFEAGTVRLFAESLWALYRETVKRLAALFAGPPTGDILFSHLKKTSAR